VSEQPPVRVLLIEDEPRIASFLAKGLTKIGWDVVVAEDGAVGLFLATTDSFDAVVLDLGLPDTDGISVLTAIRAEERETPVVVLTGQDDPGSRRACAEAGAAGLLTKPFTFADLRAELTRHVQAARG